jgi:pimeloyl-ACP methyl ester carboxylesterase
MRERPEGVIVTRVALSDPALEVYYEEAGEGTPVVFVGGFTSTAATWRCQVPALADRHRVLVPENRGSGRTRVVGEDNGSRSVWGWATDLLAFVDALQLDRVHVAGCSMGGRIVQAFACRWPDRLLSLSLLCASPGGEHAVAGDPEVAAAVAVGSRPDATLEQQRAAVAAMFHPDTPARAPDTVRAFQELREVEAHTAEELVRRTQAMTAPFSVWDELGVLGVPALVITGEADQLLPPENSRRLAARIPRARLVLVPGGGHLFFMEQPEATNRELLAHFAAAELGGGGGYG